MHAYHTIPIVMKYPTFSLKFFANCSGRVGKQTVLQNVSLQNVTPTKRNAYITHRQQNILDIFLFFIYDYIWLQYYKVLLIFNKVHSCVHVILDWGTWCWTPCGCSAGQALTLHSSSHCHWDWPLALPNIMFCFLKSLMDFVSFTSDMTWNLYHNH